MKPIHMVEGILVVFVIFLLLAISIPRFMRVQTVHHVKSVDALVKTMRDYCVDDYRRVSWFRSKYSLMSSSGTWGPIYNANNRIKANIKVKFTVIELNTEKWLQECDLVDCDPALLEG